MAQLTDTGCPDGWRLVGSYHSPDDDRNGDDRVCLFAVPGSADGEASKHGFGLLPWGEHHIHLLIRTAGLPVERRKPVILLDTYAVTTWKINRDSERRAA
jgi:hypothetical protein